MAAPGASAAVDLVLPGDCPLGGLLPSIVDLAAPEQVPGRHRWVLSRLAGPRLDPAMTLREHGVVDGDLLLLTAAEPPAPQRITGDPAGTVAAAAEAPRAPKAPGPVLAAAAWVACAAALAWSGSVVRNGWHGWVAVAAAVAAAAVAGSRRTAAPAAAAFGVGAVAFAAVAGYLAVPQSDWASALLLAASAGLAVATLLLRLTGGTTQVATTVLTGTVALVAALSVMLPMSRASAGAALAVVAVAGLSAAPALTVAVTGLGPARPDPDGGTVAAAHRLLTGLVAGLCAAAVLGAVAVVTDAGAPGPVPFVFVAVVGALLLLRQRTHRDPRRRLALRACGVAALAVAAAAGVLAAPGHAHWICAAAVTGVGAAVAAESPGAEPGPVRRQALQAGEYLALAAVVPLAAWVSGAYEFVRGMSL